MFSDPKHNIEQFMLGEGSKVADLGAGSGHYTIAAAKAVGDSGKVFAVDVQKDLLERISALAKEEKLHNVSTVWGNIDKLGGSKIRDGSVDAAIVSNVFFQLDDKEEAIREVGRILRSGGKVMFVDWTDSFGGLGPPAEDIVTEDEVKMLFSKHGFVVDKSMYAGEHHFGIIFRKEHEAR